MDQLEKARPDLAKKVRAGESGPAAIRQMKADENRARLEDTKARQVKEAAG